MEYFQKTIELDPDYAEAHAYIGETYLHFAGFRYSVYCRCILQSKNSRSKSDQS